MDFNVLLFHVFSPLFFLFLGKIQVKRESSARLDTIELEYQNKEGLRRRGRASFKTVINESTMISKKKAIR